MKKQDKSNQNREYEVFLSVFHDYVDKSVKMSIL